MVMGIARFAPRDKAQLARDFMKLGMLVMKCGREPAIPGRSPCLNVSGGTHRPRTKHPSQIRCVCSGFAGASLHLLAFICTLVQYLGYRGRSPTTVVGVMAGGLHLGGEYRK